VLRPVLAVQALFSLALFCVFSTPVYGAESTGRLPVALSDHEAIGLFYAERDGDPVWIENRRLNSKARDLVVVLRQSWMNGLNPKNYHMDAIEDLMGSEELNAKVEDRDDAITLEMVLTDAYIRYRRDLSGMRINPADMGLRRGDWQQQISVDKALLDLKEHEDNISDFLLESEPQGRTYQTLKTELVRLIEKSAQEDHTTLFFDTLLSPGQGHKNVPLLRARFGLPNVSDDMKYTYDSNLVDAVKDFQKANGLKPDGLIGEQTQNALNKTQRDKIHQIIVNLERLRWIPEEKPSKFIVVNLPSAMLWAIEEGKVAHEMPVIIGRKKRATETFVSEIHGVRFNPTWTVPKTIKKEDIIPQLIENASFLTDKGMEIYQDYEDGESITIDPASVDWASLSEDDLQVYRMVQTSGDHNPLGRIRVLMPNEYNIYLHDTNHHGLFSRSNRAQSSGCVRMKYPEKIADFILKQRSDWSEDVMINILKSGEMKDLYVRKTMPVYMLYNTVWLGDKNQVIFGGDVYGHDKKLWQVIEKLDGFANIDHNEVIAGTSVDKF